MSWNKLILMWKWLWPLFLIFSFPVMAAGLDETTVKLSRMQSGASPLPVLVTGKSVSAVTENGVRVTVGSGWQVSNNASNISVTTTGLPSGVSPWPGVGVATSVSGQAINFPSSDLVAGTKYGFYITGGIGVNPGPGQDMSYKWRVATTTLSGVDVETELKVPVVGNDQLAITGRVGAKATDFQLALQADRTAVLQQDEQINYVITYGSYLATQTKPLKITAKWSRGTVSGSPIPTVDIVNYVVGSGSSTSSGINPVIDLINRTISWTITSFPANQTDETVSFSLKTNSSYTGVSQVSFDTTATLMGANVLSMDEVVNHTYKFHAAPTPTLVPTSTPTPIISPLPTETPAPGKEGQTPTGRPTTAPTATPTLAPLMISDVEIINLDNNSIHIEAESNVLPDSVKVRIGDNISDLDLSLTLVDQKLDSFLKIPGLEAGTDYYFIIEMRRGDEVVRSEMYTFRTPTETSGTKLESNTLIVTSQDTIINNPTSGGEKESTPLVVIPKNQLYSFKVNLQAAEAVSELKVIVRNEQVLGITSVYGAEPNTVETNMISVDKTGFAGQLVSPTAPGYYGIYVRIYDIFGNITEEKLANLKVMNPIKVARADNGSPIEGASVHFLHFNEKNRVYEDLPSRYMGMVNPSFTESNGEISLALPQGKYRIDVEQIGYVDKSVDFTLGPGAEETMPLVLMIRKNVSVTDLSKYYGQVGEDTLNFSKKFIGSIFSSGRFFQLAVLQQIVLMVILGVVWLSKTTKVSWVMLPEYFLKTMAKKKPGKGVIWGKVLDGQDKSPISRATVFLIDKSLNKVLDETATDFTGSFEFKLKSAKEYGLAATAVGYETGPMMEYLSGNITEGEIVISLEKFHATKGTEVKLLRREIIQVVVGALVLINLLGQWFFSRSFGLTAVLGPAIITIINSGLWFGLVLRIEKKDES